MIMVNIINMNLLRGKGSTNAFFLTQVKRTFLFSLMLRQKNCLFFSIKTEIYIETLTYFTKLFQLFQQNCLYFVN